MAEVGRLESCKAEVMRRLIKDKWSDVEAVCAASHLVTPAIPAMYDAAVSTDRMPNGGQVMLAADWAHVGLYISSAAVETPKVRRQDFTSVGYTLHEAEADSAYYNQMFLHR